MNVTSANFVDFLTHLFVDLVALLILAVVLYYRRYHRRDLLTSIVCFNVSLFVVLAVIDVRSTSIGVGFGLFALLSIISLRSETFSTIELGYFFAGLVIGVVNGLEVGGKVLDPQNELFAIMLTASVIVVIWLIDLPQLHQAQRHQQITLDQVHSDPAALRADLEQRLGASITTTTVLHTDYVQQTMLVDVRYRQDPS